MRVLTVGLIVLMVVVGFGCSNSGQNEYVLDSTYNSQYYSVCYPADIFYIAGTNSSFTVRTYPKVRDYTSRLEVPYHGDTQLTYIAVENSKAIYGDLDSVSGWVQSRYGNLHEEVSVSQITFRGHKAVEFTPVNIGDIEKILIIPFDGWLGIASVYKTAYTKTANNILKTLLLKKPSYPTEKMFQRILTKCTVFEIDDLWSKLVGYDSVDFSWSKTYPDPINTSNIRKVDTLTVQVGDEELEITTWDGKTNIFELDTPEDWSVIRFNKDTYTILPNKYLDKPEFLFWNRVDSNIETNGYYNWDSLYYFEAFPNISPKITVDVDYEDRSIFGNVEVMLKLDPDYNECELNKTIFLGYWANKTETQEDGNIIERYDIPFDGWIATVKIYSTPNEYDTVKGIAETLAFKTNPNTHYNANRYDFKTRAGDRIEDLVSMWDFIDIDFEKLDESGGIIKFDGGTFIIEPQDNEMDIIETVRFEPQKIEKVEDVIMENP
ncbi:MAG TPA: hypothetical protein PKV16_05400 [Caldisericia bacterium]|nr:hypothetical protein [Caldisericia bacterium]HPF48747.1 hypothetical protein [Caldisericia bacterium]HPI83593.1 hypothetical protein [Caldisericia bacterium]HPQ93202.1 hypothetical protein [Caldisericia bacterium]HRV74965.1 hypothetical protein [Caldisericia bacterium]